jgi:hypothetical protein
MFLSLLACAPEKPEEFLAWVEGEEGYSITARSIPELEDALHMKGSLGQVTYGGHVPLTGTRYTGGQTLIVPYDLQNGVAIPADVDGLMLYSFYGNLGDARRWVEAHNQSLDAIFPLAMAWNPAVSPLIEFSAADNAAYAVGNNFFVLLPDGQHRKVPLLANRGVIAHELGHAVFHLLTAGDPFAPMLVEDPSSTAGRWQSSLHEAFADVQAALLTEDPAFISASLDMPSRDLSRESVMTEAILPDNGSPLLYDPYPAGTVFASLLWELRVQTDDPDETYALLLRTAAAWRPKTVNGASWMETLLAQADADQREILCEVAMVRLGEFWDSSGSCP